MSRKQVSGTSHMPLSLAVRAGDSVVVPGQVPVALDGTCAEDGIEIQAQQASKNVKAPALAGSSMEELVKTTLRIGDASDFGGINDVYGRFFAKDPPAWTRVESRLTVDIEVGIEAVTSAPVN